MAMFFLTSISIITDCNTGSFQQSQIITKNKVISPELQYCAHLPVLALQSVHSLQCLSIMLIKGHTKETWKIHQHKPQRKIRKAQM